MSLFKRSKSADTDHAVAGFWAWWRDEGAAATAAALAERMPELVSDAISAQVSRIDPRLAWELAPGSVSEHQLVVTCGGNPDLRPLARRWLLAALPADATWAYSDQRPPAQDPESLTLSSEGAPDIGFADVRVSARRTGNRFDVVVHHPDFASLPAEARLRVAFLALDGALGETDVELWIGAVEAAESSPLDGFGLNALRAVVQDFKAEHLDEDGHFKWAIMRGDGPQGPVLAMAQVPLHPVTAPHLSTHVGMTLEYADRSAEGWPGPGSLDALRELEDRLVEFLGSHGQVVAHESTAGVRVLHAYVDGATDAAQRVRRAKWAWPQGRLQVAVTEDPGWESVRHLRG
jgi:hypothetical protein